MCAASGVSVFMYTKVEISRMEYLHVAMAIVRSPICTDHFDLDPDPLWDVCSIQVGLLHNRNLLDSNHPFQLFPWQLPWKL